MIEALKVSDLTCHYKGQAILADLSFRVERGEIVCLLGASGCGKTTLLKAIAGLLELESGEIEINQRKVFDEKVNLVPEKRNVGMIFQDYALFPHLTVEENIGFGLKDMPLAKRKLRVAEMLTLVKLEPHKNRYPHQLSGGQQQRVAIARALAYKPDLLLLDEPFSNIDTQVRYGLIKEIRRIFKAQGVTAIFVTHNHEEAFAFSDKLAVMHQGVIEQYGTPSSLYYEPSNRFVAQFLGHSAKQKVLIVSPDKMKTPFGDYQLPLPLATGEYEWFIRPQHLLIKVCDTGAATIIETHFMGDSSRYKVAVSKEAGSEQNVMIYSDQRFNLGDKIDIQILPHKPILFLKD